MPRSVGDEGRLVDVSGEDDRRMVAMDPRRELGIAERALATLNDAGLREIA